MPKEDEQKPALPFEQVIRVAREVIFRDGYHRPTVIVDGSLQSIATQIDQLAPTHEGRAQQMFLLGAILAEQIEFGVLQQAFLITEAWMSMSTPDKPVRLRPSQDPQRKEILVVSRLQVEPHQIDVIVFEMKRNSNGKLIRLDRQVATENADFAESPLLRALAIGLLGSTSPRDD